MPVHPPPGLVARRTRASDIDGAPEWLPADLDAAADQDDVSGSGVFDDRPNLHAGDGVFESAMSLPGYAARESGLGPSEVIDQQTGTPTQVFLPGMTNMQNRMWSTQPRYPTHPPVGVTPNFKRILSDTHRGRVPSDDTSMGLEMATRPVAGQWAQGPMNGYGWVTWQNPEGAVNGLRGVFGALGDAASDMPLWQWGALGVAVGVGLAIVKAKRAHK